VDRSAILKKIAVKIEKKINLEIQKILKECMIKIYYIMVWTKICNCLITGVISGGRCVVKWACCVACQAADGPFSKPLLMCAGRPAQTQLIDSLAP